MTIRDRLAKFLGQTPQIAPDAFVHDRATVIGAVSLGPKASVWPGCVLRADIERIDIGEGTNIQDGTVIHMADDMPVRIGKYTTVGHMAMLHACTIGDECLIGMSATVLDGAVIGDRSIVGAGALVTKGTLVPPGSLVLGSPAKVVKSLSAEEQAKIRGWAEKYTHSAAAHRELRQQGASATDPLSPVPGARV